MSLDVFGRILAPRTGGKGPPGEGFKLTNEGNYDIQGKVLTNIGDPIKNTDSVNLKTLENNCLLYKKDYIDAKSRYIINLKDPNLPQDAVNKSYVDSLVPTKDNGQWRFGKRRLTNVADPQDESDVVTKKFLMSNTPKKTNQGWNFDNKRLILLKDPAEPQDAVTMSYLSRTVDEIIDTLVPKQNNNNWSFDDKRLTQVGDAIEPSDAINYKTLSEKLLTVLENLKEIRVFVENQLEELSTNINGTSDKLTTIQSNTERQLRKFGQLLFPYVQGSHGRSADVTAENYLNWQEIFGSRT